MSDQTITLPEMLFVFTSRNLHLVKSINAFAALEKLKGDFPNQNFELIGQVNVDELVDKCQINLPRDMPKLLPMVAETDIIKEDLKITDENYKKLEKLLNDYKKNLKNKI